MFKIDIYDPWFLLISGVIVLLLSTQIPRLIRHFFAQNFTDDDGIIITQSTLAMTTVEEFFNKISHGDGLYLMVCYVHGLRCRILLKDGVLVFEEKTGQKWNNNFRYFRWETTVEAIKNFVDNPGTNLNPREKLKDYEDLRFVLSWLRESRRIRMQEIGRFSGIRSKKWLY